MNTKIEAFRVVQSSARATRVKILNFAKGCGTRGFIVDEIVATWNCSVNHVAPRVVELAKSGRLVLTRERRLTRSGFLANVYVVAASQRPLFPLCDQAPALARHRDDN